MKSRPPLWANKRTPVLRAEHNVIMKAKKCRAHNPILLLLPLLPCALGLHAARRSGRDYTFRLWPFTKFVNVIGNQPHTNARDAHRATAQQDGIHRIIAE